MRKLLIGLTLAALAAPASAALPVGAKAPDFTATGALAGKPFRFQLAELLKRGPVVLYFYPKAFTKGCTLEARAFSEAGDDFRKAGAQVIGMSADNLETLKRFSVEECRNGRIAFVHSDLNWSEHVQKTLAAVKALKKK
jgi:peroxiredoxin